MSRMPGSWSPFRRRDPSAAVRIVRDLATSGDPGTYGHGVEVVLESPPLRWWNRFYDRMPRDQARIAVTGVGGVSGYPVHVRLVTGLGAHALRRVDRRDGWATGLTAMRLREDASAAGHGTAAGTARTPHPLEQGETILVLKRGRTAGFQPDDAAAELVAGTVAALADLHPFAPNRGWRARVDRDVRRT